MFRVAIFSICLPAAWLSLQPSCLAQSSTRGSGTIIQRGTIIQNGSSTGRSTFPSGGSSSRVAAPQPSFEQKFWTYLQSSHYKNWAPVPGKTGGAYAGQSPHGAMLKMYLNRTAVGQPGELPAKSILVKENYGADGKTLMAITVMYKTQGYNAEGGDWYWVKYRPDGKVDVKATPTGSVKLAGKPTGCIECHAAAEGGDFAFFND